MRSLYRRVEDTGYPDLPLLSVYRDHGVVQRSDRDDNYNKPGTDLSAYKVVRRHNLVINKMKTWQGSLGVSSFSGIVSPAYFVGKRIGDVDDRFMHHLLRSQPLVAEYGARSKGIRPSQWDLPWDEFASIKVRLPPIAEQQTIADYLDAETARIDTLISKKRRLIEVLAEHRTALITQTVTHGLDPSPSLRPSGVDWLGDIPSHWGSPKISHVAVLGSGHTPSRSVPEWWVPQECTVPWITTGEVANLRSDRIEYIERTRECVSEIGLANSSAVVHPAGTVVLSRTASVGYSGIMATDMATSQDFATWTCGPSLLPRFLLLCLRAMRPDLLGRLTMGSTHKTIYMPDIQSLAIPLPPISEQHQIINAVWKQLKRLGPAEDRITAQISLLRESRQALISAAVTGDLATPGLATETPTVRPISP